MNERGYIYLASPYSHPDSSTRYERYLSAANAARTLLQNKLWVYSPIVHCHDMSERWGLPFDAEFWREYDRCMVQSSREIFVLCLSGWEQSVGVAGEIRLAAELSKPVTYLHGTEWIKTLVQS